MKGYTKIELFDGLTGKLTERVEDHNMMTGAIGKIARAALAHPYRGSRTFLNPFGQHINMLSGLCLFDSEITENVNNIWLPAGVKPVAYAAVGFANNNDNARMMGTYDNTESDTSANLTKKWVWNWAPSQGNGTIKSACLTHYSAGFFGFGGNQGTENNAGFGIYSKNIGLASICQRPKGISKVNGVATGDYPAYRYVGTVGSNYLDMCIDSDNNYKYMYKVSANSLSVIRHKMDFEKFDVFRSTLNHQSYDEETYAGTFTGGGYFRGFYNTDEKKLYFWLDNGQSVYGSGYTCTIYVYDIVNKTVGTHGTFTTSYNNTATGLVVTNSAVYFATTYQNVKVYKYSFQSAAITLCSGQVDTAESYRNQWPLPVNYILNGIITFPTQKAGLGGAYADILIDTSDDSARYTVCSSVSLYLYMSYQTYDRGYVPVIPPYDNTQVMFGFGNTNVSNSEGYPRISGYCMTLEDSRGDSSSNSIYADTFAPCNYLGTINNLPDTVIKDATKSMKLTYIISAEDEE